MRAPFPYFGSKRRIAETVWSRFGNPQCYIEPFAGSIAVLLQRKNPRGREIVCDKDGLIVNFWRAMKHAPEAVAEAADYPAYQHDLTARHNQITLWRDDGGGRFLSNEPDYFDAEVAGWWAFGMSIWIGRGFCASPRKYQDQVPSVTGSGIAVSRAERGDIPIGDGKRLLPMFRQLQQRLAHVVVLNKSWEAAVTNSMIGPTKPVAIFLDPPYSLVSRQPGLYAMDDSGDTAADSYRWACEHGEEYRIAYCCTEGDVPVPPGWTAVDHHRQGSRVPDVDRKSSRTDCVMFSPACITPQKALL